MMITLKTLSIIDLRDYYLNKKLEKDFQELTLMLETKRAKKELKEKIIFIESNYQKYPRVACQIVQLYSEVHQKKRAANYLNHILNVLDEKMTVEERLFTLHFAENFYRYDYPDNNRFKEIGEKIQLLSLSVNLANNVT